MKRSLRRIKPATSRVRNERPAAIRNSSAPTIQGGSAVPESLLWETVEELEKQFRAVSWETQIVRGIWQHEGTIFRDNNTRLVLDVEDSDANREFFVRLKARLKERFNQLDIWITSHAIDVI